MSSLTDAMGAWTRLLLPILLHFEKKKKKLGQADGRVAGSRLDFAQRGEMLE